jgi:2-pyrone-4,6-dicarboxylate lactonase
MTRVCLPPITDYTKVNFLVPKGACDSHVHVFGPFSKYPLAEDRSYTPQEFLADRFIDHLDKIGFSRGVVVTASVCGTNNESLLDALSQYPDRLRGVVVPDINVSDQELDRWHDLGVRGARFNLLRIDGQAMYRNGVGLEVLEKLAPKFAERGWHAQIWAHAPDLPELAPKLLKLGIPLVVDHMGRMNTSRGLNNSGFQFLCKLLAEGAGWVKISGADRIGDVSKAYEDVDPFTNALLQANPDNIVWGTDWPHINYFDPALIPDDGRLVNLLSRWIGDPDTMEQVLVTNPMRLYDFPKA